MTSSFSVPLALTTPNVLFDIIRLLSLCSIRSLYSASKQIYSTILKDAQISDLIRKKNEEVEQRTDKLIKRIFTDEVRRKRNAKGNDGIQVITTSGLPFFEGNKPNWSFEIQEPKDDETWQIQSNYDGSNSKVIIPLKRKILEEALWSRDFEVFNELVHRGYLEKHFYVVYSYLFCSDNDPSEFNIVTRIIRREQRILDKILMCAAKNMGAYNIFDLIKQPRIRFTPEKVNKAISECYRTEDNKKIAKEFETKLRKHQTHTPS